MARLHNVPSRLTSLPSRIPKLTDQHGHSAVVEHWRKWYSTARWARLRKAVFLRDLFQCQQPGCGVLVTGGPDAIADHKTPHRGDPALFWSEANVQTLCKPCHDRLKQAEERRTAIGL